MESSSMTKNNLGKTHVMYSKKRNTIEERGGSLCQIVDVHTEIKKLPHSLEKEFCESPQLKSFQSKDVASTKHLPNCSKNLRGTKREELLQPGAKQTISPHHIANDRGDFIFEMDLEDFNEEASYVSDLQRINSEIDGDIENRMSQIENEIPNDVELLIKTHEECTESLLKRNKAVINAIKELSHEHCICTELFAVDADTRLKFYRDRDVLIKLIQDAFHKGEWNFDDLSLETMDLKEILQEDLEKTSDDSDPSEMVL